MSSESLGADECNYRIVTDFVAETAMTVGGWNPRYARVLDVQVQGDVAAALVDANGDGADLNVDIHVRQPDGEWGEVASGNGSIGIPGWLACHTADDLLILSRVVEPD
jgi:hypothetical protein